MSVAAQKKSSICSQTKKISTTSSTGDTVIPTVTQTQQKISVTNVQTSHSHSHQQIQTQKSLIAERKLSPAELPVPKKGSITLSTQTVSQCVTTNSKTSQPSTKTENSTSPAPISKSQIHIIEKQKSISSQGRKDSLGLPKEKDQLVREMSGMKLEKMDSTLKEYPDSDDENDQNLNTRKKSGPLQYGTISNWQAENLENMYKDYVRFPTSEAVKEFIEKYNISQAVVEIWLETRRELTYHKYLKLGLETEPSVIKFYSEAMKTSEGVRLEQPAIRSKSFFSIEGINAIEAKKELEEKEQPSINLSTNKLFMDPNKEEKCQILVKNDGEVNIVYQLSMINSENYIMSPICAILHPDEELTLNITRKPGPLEDEFFRIDYGRNIDGVIDARESADRGYLSQREIVQVVAIDESEMKIVR